MPCASSSVSASQQGITLEADLHPTQEFLTKIHPLSKTQIQLVQTSFEAVRPIADVAAELFYQRLFELEPGLRPLFTGDMKEQGRKLMTMLSLVVKNLEYPDKIIPAAQQLGARHVRYGVEEHHYAIVGQALLWTLEQGLNEQFTPAVEAAWATAYTFLSGAMIDAARQSLVASPHIA